LGNIAWRLENLKVLFGGRRFITKETVLASRNKSAFSNEKFSKAFNAEFQPVAETIRNMGKYFRKDLQEGWLDRNARNWRNQNP
jgi:hypothetical protein